MKTKQEADPCAMADFLDKALDKCYPTNHPHCQEVKFALTAAMKRCNQYNIGLFDKTVSWSI